MSWKHIGKSLAAGAVLLLGVGWGPMALATTKAGERIVNNATLGYQVNNVAQPDVLTLTDPNDCGATEVGGVPVTGSCFVVDRRLNVSVVLQDGQEVTIQLGGTAILHYEVTNLSNDDIELVLGLSRNNGFDVFNLTPNGDALTAMSVVRLCEDAACLAEYASDGNFFRTSIIDAGDTVSVFVEFELLASEIASRNDWESWSLAAGVTDPGSDPDNVVAIEAPYASCDSNGRLAFGTAGSCDDDADEKNVIQNVFADAGLPVDDESYGYNFLGASGAGAPSSAFVQANDGQFAATGQLIVAAPAMMISKTSRVVWDPINEGCATFSVDGANAYQDMGTTEVCDGNPKRIPGAIIEYTITVENGGNVAASAVSVADDPPDNTQSIMGTNVVFTHACDADGTFMNSGQTVAGGFTASLGTCAAGNTGAVVFYVEID